MPQIEVSPATNEHIKAIALLLESTPEKAVEKLVLQAKHSMVGNLPPAPSPDADADAEGSVAVYFTYLGYRSEGTLALRTGKLRVTSSPWNGKVFGSPSGAAGAVILYYNPDRAVFRNGTWQPPASNGWKEWRLVSNGQLLQTVRPM